MPDKLTWGVFVRADTGECCILVGQVEQGTFFEAQQGILAFHMRGFGGTQVEQQSARSISVPPAGQLFLTEVEHGNLRQGKGFPASVPHGTAFAQIGGVLRLYSCSVSIRAAQPSVTSRQVASKLPVYQGSATSSPGRSV